jgi:hypothetical protein
MWLAALGGRLAYVAHRARGHAATWKTSPPDLPLCTGDIVCYDCERVLWCRAHDPWRVQAAAGDEGAAHPAAPARRDPSTLLDGLQRVLQLATQCAPGPAGDNIRRAACELIEADSDAARATRRHRILTAIASVEWRLSNGRSREDDPAPATLRRLAAAVRAND